MEPRLLLCILLTWDFSYGRITQVRNKRSLHVPPPHVPTFLRSQVEKAPEAWQIIQDRSSPYKYSDEFGSRSLPLRSAVERVPNVNEATLRLPLRDAVEKRLPPDEAFDLEFEAPEIYNWEFFKNAWDRAPDKYLFSPNSSFSGSRAERLLSTDYEFIQNEIYRNTYPKNDKRIICYVEGVAGYRKPPMTFNPEDVDPFMCTHVIYAFAALDPHTYEIMTRDEEYDLIRGAYISLIGLRRKNPQLKVMIALTERNYKRFHNLTSNVDLRHNFVESVVNFLTINNFDGLDLHWNYYEEDNYNPKDGANFGTLLEELSEAFTARNWILSASIPALRFRNEDSFDSLQLANTVDFVNMQAYDFHSDESLISPVSLSLKYNGNSLDTFYNVKYAVNYWLNKGLPRSKLVVGIPFFGRTFTLQYIDDSKLEAYIKGPGKEGHFTQNPGFLSYFEICDMINSEGLKKKTDSSGYPYVISGDQWISYDDPESIHKKMNYIRDLNLGGLFVWSVDLDDFNGLCKEKWPLMRTIRRYLENEHSTYIAENVAVQPLGMCSTEGIYSDPKNCANYYMCRSGLTYHLSCGSRMLFDPNTASCNFLDANLCRPGQTVFIPSVPKSLVRSGHVRTQSTSPKVVCYFTNWSFYRKSEGKFVPEYLDQGLCTHIVYAYATLEPEKLSIKEFDPWADLDNKLYQRVTALTNSKVLLALGGWTDSAGDKFSRLVGSGTLRHKFVIGVVSFLRKHAFRGLHFDWNYPICWQSNCKKGPASDKPNFTKLIRELRNEFDKENPPLELAVAISGYKEVIDVAYDLPALGEAADFLSVMTYDYHGSWEKRTGHVSPLYGRADDQYPQYNTNFTMEYLVSNGAPREKLLIGIPFYGQSFTVSKSNSRNGLGIASTGPGEPGEYTKQPGMLSYYEICARTKSQRWSVTSDPQQLSGPYAYNGNQWVGYEDVQSIRNKGNYIRNRGFGGAVAWTVDLDDFQNKCCQKSFPLLRSLNVGLGLLSSDEPFHGDCSKPPQPVTPQPPVMTTGFDTGSHSSTTHHHDHVDTTPSPTTKSTPSWWTTTQSWDQSISTTKSTPAWWTSSSGTSSTTEKSSTWWSSPTPSSTTTTEKPITWWSQPSSTTTSEKPNTWWSSTTPSTTTNTPWFQPESTTLPTPAVVMPEVQDDLPAKCETGQYVPDKYNCNAYYRCVLGDFKKQYCAGGLHWNKQSGICDWPAVAKCKEGKPLHKPTVLYDEVTRPSTTTTRRTVTTTTRTTTTAANRPLDGTLEKCTSGAYYPHEHCSSFYVCVNGQLLMQKCAPGLYWNVESSLCDWDYKTKCVNRKQLALQTVKMVKEDSEASHTPHSACQAGSYSTYAGDCTQYLFCLWNKYESFACADGLHWNNDQKICDWPANSNCKEVAHDDHVTLRPTKPTQQTPLYESTSHETPSHEWSSSTAPPEEVTTEALEPLSGQYKIVCYFTNWAWYRKGLGKYVPEDIDSNLCTHVIYGFAVLDYENLIVRAHDSWADFDNKFYSRVVAYKKKGLKVLLALGGWNDSMGDKYSRLVNNPASRAKFITHVLEFLAKYDFDGLDLDWEYPKCWQVDCKKGPDSDKAAFAAFVTELKQAFRPRGYLLSAAVSPSRTVIDAGYDVPTLAKYLDWIAVMTYDFHGQWDKKTGHVAPLHYHPEDDVAFFNSNYSINYWISRGVPSRKIVMGMPLYGQSFQLEKSENNGLNAKAPGPGQAGEFTRAAGFLAYYEICDKINNQGWTVVQDPQRRMGPYAYKGNQWVSFDDLEMIRLKSEFIKKMNLGGGMIWALDLDDFRNRCGQGKHPLLSAIRKVLASSNEAPDTAVYNDVDTPHQPVTSSSVAVSVVTTPIPHSTTEPPKVDPDSEFKVVCYFTNWAWYRQGVGKYLPGDIDPDLCTHIVYGFAVLNGDQLVIKPHDTWADFDNKFYEKVTALKSKGIKVLIAIGGWNDSAGDKYSRLVNNPSARKRFIDNVLEFIEKNNFDGLDLDWEYPKCWQVDCNKGPASDKEAFADFVRELHHALRPRGLLLSSAVSPSKRVVDAGYDVPALSRYLDWIAVMCYDYHGQWDKITGHVAPMYSHPDDIDATFNTNFTINYWINRGADRKKIVMGMPTYGQSFSLRERQDHGLNAPTYGGGEAGEETRARGFLSYYEICANIIKKQWTVVRDKKNRIGPYAYSGDQWVSFDDVTMIKYKSEYIKNMGLGGGMIWALDLDDFKNICGCENYPLLRTINRVLRNYAVPAPKCELGHDIVPRPTKTVTYKPTTESWQTKKPQNEWDRVTPTTGAPTSEPSSCRGRLFVEHKSNCNQYYLCNQGQLVLQACPSGLFWNNDHCDWPENTRCHPDATTLHPTTSRKEEVTEPIATSRPTIAVTQKPFSPGTTINPNRESYKVVCYFTNWAWYRQEKGKYVPSDIDPTLCTHITYGFAVLDPNSLTIKSHDPWADVDNGFYKKVVAFKSYGIKVLIALGGWNDSLGNKYSRLVNNPESRARFIADVVSFIEKWSFDGLDLDWEYPKCWQVDCNKGPESDKRGFADLVTELSAVFKPKGLLLSSAVSPSKTVIDAGYDVPTLSRYFDWIAVMTYDFHGHWDKQTGHVAPLYYYPEDTYDYFNSNFSLHYWIEMGADPSKLIMGMPLYGQAFSLADQSKNELNSQTYGPGEAGEYTRAGGFMAFYEICERVKRRSWTVVRDKEGRMGPYAYNGNQWVSYDDIAEIRRKSKLIKTLGLGGGMIWALDLDDFRNVCGCGKHPLLKTLNNELRNVPLDTHLENCT